MSSIALPTRQFRLTVRHKFFIGVTLLTVAGALLTVAIARYNVRKTVSEQTAAQSAALADTVAATSAYYVVFGLADDLRSIVGELARNPAVEYADFITADGTVLAATNRENLPVDYNVAPRVNRPVDRVASGASGSLYLSVRPIFESAEDAAAPDATPRGFFRIALNESSAERALRNLALTNFAIIAGGLLIGLVLSALAARLIVGPLTDLASAAGSIAGGDLTRRAAVGSRDELGDLAGAFNGMAVHLEKTLTKIAQAQGKIGGVAESVESRSRRVIGSVDEQSRILDDAYAAVDKLNSGIRKISSNVEALSAASEETSSSILEMIASMEEVGRHTDTLFTSVEETASATTEMVTSISEVDRNMEHLESFVTDTSASMTEMSASIAQVGSNAARSHDVAVTVTEAAEGGMRAVRETIDAIELVRRAVVETNSVVGRLGDRSAEIGKILNVIDDVAEQTNLLALNAAILAAQAGEQGKGFSVVAAEIRDLSERTASSTKEIASLIRAVQDEVANVLDAMSDGSTTVEGGVRLAHEAGRELNRILELSGRSSEMSREIANATGEQARGSEAVTQTIERIRDMVRQINTATRQQASGSEHIMKAVESMREVTRYVRQAMAEQKSGSGMISRASEKMIDMVHEIFEVTTNQAQESEKIVGTVERVREFAEENRASANEMSQSITLLNEAIRSLDEEMKRFRIRR
jgi:methyl-accepting chemotaxis protein